MSRRWQDEEMVSATAVQIRCWPVGANNICPFHIQDVGVIFLRLYISTYVIAFNIFRAFKFEGSAIVKQMLSLTPALYLPLVC